MLLPGGGGLGLEAQLEDGGGHLHAQLLLRRGRSAILLPAVIPLNVPARLLRQDFPGNAHHLFRLHVPRHSEHHVGGGVERLVAGVEGVGGDVGDGLLGAGDGHPDGVVVKQALHQAVKHLVVRIVLHHADLLADDPLLLVHALLGKPGNGHEGEENFQVVAEFLRAFKIVAGEGRAGESVGGSPVGRQILEGVAVLGIEHLVLQEVGHPRRSVPPLAIQPELHIHAAVVGGKKGVALLKLGPPVHIDVQAVGQLRVIDFLPDAGVFFAYHGLTPCLSGNRPCPASASGPPPVPAPGWCAPPAGPARRAPR